MTHYSAAIDPAHYEAWYHSPRGRWIAGREFALLQALLSGELPWEGIPGAVPGEILIALQSR